LTNLHKKSRNKEFLARFLSHKNSIKIKLNFAIAECKEYSKYVYVNEASPIMSASSSQSNLVSKCGIVETPLIVGGKRVYEIEFPHMVSTRS